MAKTRQELKQINKRARRRLFKIRLVALAVLGVLILFGLVASLNLDRWQIEEVLVRGNKVLGSGELIGVAESELAGKYWHLIPRRQRWFYPEEALRARILQDFPRLKSVLTYTDTGSLVLVVSEYSPTAIWCSESDDNCLFVNDRAWAFSPAPEFSSPIYLTIKTASTTSLVPAPASFNALDLRRLINFQTDLQTILGQYWPDPVDTYLVTRLEGSDYNFTIELPTSSRHFDLRIDLETDPVTVLSTLEALLDSDELITKLASRDLVLEYLDLRFAPKVFYRFRD